MRYPRYVTYTDDELRATIRQIDPTGISGVTVDQLRMAGSAVGGRLIKSHSCCVTFPDGATGSCRYTRCGPNWHQFHYQHEGREGTAPIVPASLPVHHFTSRMENTVDAIAAKAKELAEEVYRSAIRAEWKDYFRRSLPPNHRTVDSAACHMTAKRAKEIGGKYALCLRLGEKLVPSSEPFETIEEANAQWKERRDPRFFVACACRWARRWEVPKYNPLYADMDSQLSSTMVE